MIVSWSSPFLLARSVFAAIKAKLSGKKLFTTEDIAHSRLEECHKCPSLDEENLQCRECTCFVHIKAIIESEKCPKRRWLL